MADFVDPSVTAAIVAAKDKLVVESNRAEVIVDQWYATGNLVQDAPSDGIAYNRKDSEWVEAASGGGGGSGDMLKATYDPTNIEGDAFARSNHTGSQAIATVTGLQTALDANVEEAPIDSKTYGRKNETWVEVAAGTSKNDVYTASVVTSSIPETILNWRNTAAGKYKFVWNTFANYTAWNGFPSIDAPDSQITWYVEVQVLPSSHRLITAYNDTVQGVWTLDTTDETGSAYANPLYSKKVPSSILDIEDVITTNLASNIGKVLTVYSATEVAFLNAPSGATNLGNTPAASTVALTSSSGTGTTLPAATTSLAGVMTAADKVKLNAVPASIPTTFTGLTDTPSSYSGEGGKVVQVNAGGTGLEFVTPSGGGGGDSFIPLYKFPLLDIGSTSTVTSGNWKAGFLALLNTVTPATERYNKLIKVTFSGTTMAQFDFPNPTECGIPEGESIGFLVAFTWLRPEWVSSFNFNNGTDQGVTGMTRKNRTDKLQIPVDLPNQGDIALDQTHTWLRLTAVKARPGVSLLTWMINTI